MSTIKETAPRVVFAIFLGVLAFFAALPAFAQDVATITYVQPCEKTGFSWDHVFGAIAVLGFFSAIAANWVPPESKLGRTLHFIAGNGPRLQADLREIRAIRSGLTPPGTAPVRLPPEGP